jgi:hypothetical protein
MTDKPPTGFKALPSRDGHIVTDTWNENAIIASCTKLDAAATLAMFLNGQESLARQVMSEFLSSLPEGTDTTRQ